MEKNDEEKLVRFMHEQKKEVEDNGFTRRVMRRLPGRHRRANRRFNLLCTAACLLLFYLLDGVEIMRETLQEIRVSLLEHNPFAETNAVALCIALGVFLVVGIAQACSLDDE